MLLKKVLDQVFTKGWISQWILAQTDITNMLCSFFVILKEDKTTFA